MHRIIIETEDYSGNFERQITAYTTGQLDEDGSVGLHEADLAQEDMQHIGWWKQHLVPQYDQEYLMERACEIWPHPLYVNNGYGKHFHVDSDEAQALEHRYPAYMCVAIVVDEIPPPQVWEEFGQRVIEFCENASDFSGFIKEPIGFTAIRHEPVAPRSLPRRR